MEIIQNSEDSALMEDFYSIEFQLSFSKIRYQFKLRSRQSEPAFFVVRKDSVVLNNIKQGDVVDMFFHHGDGSVTNTPRPTRIKYITEDSPFSFKNHVVVALSLECGEGHLAEETQEKELVVA